MSTTPRAIERAYRALDAALAGYPHAIHYALKANSTLAVVRLLRHARRGADANSGGEIEVALRAGFIPEQIVFTGVGKTGDELDRAVTLGAEGDQRRVARRAGSDRGARARAGTTARVALRVNPDIDAKSHPHISTGLKTNKFGMPFDRRARSTASTPGRTGLEPVGVHVHVGSQITDARAAPPRRGSASPTLAAD